MRRCAVSIVIPVYRNAGSLTELADRLRRALSPAHEDFELLLVDDGSPDNSWDVIRSLVEADARIKGIRLSRNFGQHPAIAAAFERALGDVIVLMDADLEDKPEDVPELLQKVDQNVDIAYTLKSGQSGLVTRLTSYMFHKVFSQITGRPIPGEVGTLRAFNRKVLDAVLRHREYNVLFGPLMHYVGFSSTYVPVNRGQRTYGKSSYSLFSRFSIAARTLASYTSLPHKFFLLIGFVLSGVTALYSLFIVVQVAFLDTQLPQGLTLLALLMLFSTGITLFSLGVIGSYVFRVYQEVLGRPRYLVTDEAGFETTSASPESDWIKNVRRD